GVIAKELGAKKVLPLAVGGAFHTPFMAPALEELRAAVATATLRPPVVPVVANVDARPCRDADEWPGLLAAQLVSPVRWHQSVEQLAAGGVRAVVELGPGSVRTGMAKRIDPSLTHLAVASPADLERLPAVLAGVGADAGPLATDADRLGAPLPAGRSQGA
ncbi:MAG TPA: hypothetical protein VHL53_01300, partial [Acidimicrobiia bacterium]|nr:hypothetical protein [Acidimicrobiia bacterium]